MDGEDLLEELQRQILKVEAQVDAQRSRSEPTAGALSLLRSLRLTMRALSVGIDPDDEAASSFVLFVSEGVEVFLRRDNHLVELTGPFLRALLRDAGVALFPGQVLLVDPDFARRAIEDSLGHAAAEACTLEQRRNELTLALQHSSGPSRDDLLRELDLIEASEADLRTRMTDLGELYQNVPQALANGVRGDEAC